MIRQKPLFQKEQRGPGTIKEMAFPLAGAEALEGEGGVSYFPSCLPPSHLFVPPVPAQLAAFATVSLTALFWAP